MIKVQEVYLPNIEYIDVKKEIRDPVEFGLLESLTMGAILNPSEKARKKNTEILVRRHPGTSTKIIGGFALGNELFLTFKFDDGEVAAGYIGKIPKVYIKRNPKPHSFIILSQEGPYNKVEYIDK